MQYFDCFNDRYVKATPRSGVVIPSDIPYLRRLYLFNKDAIQKHYQERNYAVKNTHILSRIVEHFPVFLNYESYRYLEYSSDKTKYLAKHFKLTSEIERGIIHPPYFFGNHGEEIIFSNTEEFNVKEAERNWKSINCVNVYKHCRNDTKILLPLGTDDKSGSGLTSISINIPLLSIKYREFIREQTVCDNNEGIVLSKNHFVIKYVLSAMLEDMVDHMFLNRVMDKFYGNEIIVPDKKYKFKIFEPTKQIDRYVEQTLDVIGDKKTDYVNLLRNIKTVFKEDASELLCINDFGGTRQAKTSVVVSRLDHMKFIYDVAPQARNMNKHYLNDWKRLAQRVIKDNGVGNMFTGSLRNEIMEKLYVVSNF